MRLDEKGTAELTFLIIAIICILGVLGFDLSNAATVRARLQTAADAASLAAVSQGEIKKQGTVVLLDANGNPTTDLDKVVEIRETITAQWPDIDPEQADAAAVAAYVKNLRGEEVPVSNVVVANLPGFSGDKPVPDPNYAFAAGVDSDNPKTAPDGSTYHDTYVISHATAGVKAYLAGKLMRLDSSGQDVLAPLNAPNQRWPGRTVPIEVTSSAQVFLK